MRLRYTDRFQRAYAGLDESDAGRVDKALRLLLANPHHPGLRTKKMQGTDNLWEARASRSLRITFQLQGELLVLRNVGRHDATLRSP